MMSSSSSAATIAVEKATSELLMNPDWTMNIDICDSVNSHHWQAKDIVKALKKRLLHKNSQVQVLALTLLETMVKNCGDYVHAQIIERNVLGEMVKIIKKKTDMRVREKILVLLDSWQEAFGGPTGRHPQFYWAYEELRRSGVEFPQRSVDAVPIFTPPVTHSPLRQNQAGYGMPSNSSRRLDETMATGTENLSLASLDSMRNIMELLSDMLRALNPSDREAVKDELIVDLVNQCRSSQKKLMQMLTTTGDEELLGRGLELNDSLQTLLAKHDAIASGSPMPAQVTNSSPNPNEACASSHNSTEANYSAPKPNGNQSAPVATVTKNLIDEDEEEDDFAQLARRHSRLRPQPVPSQSTSAVTSRDLVPINDSSTASSLPADSTANTCNALALPDPPAPVRTTQEQDMIDLLSITLSTTSASPRSSHPPSVSNQSTHQVPASPSTQGYPFASQTSPGTQGQGPYASYVVPWAQPQSQSQPQPRPQSQPQYQPQTQPQFQPQFQAQTQPQFQQQFQPQTQPQHSFAYPPPPWAATPGYFSSQNNFSTGSNMVSPPRATSPQGSTPASFPPMQGARPSQQHNSYPTSGSNGSAMNGEPRATSPKSAASFIPSYRLFEDLNVLGNGNERLKTTNSLPPNLSGASGQSMVGGGQSMVGGRKWDANGTSLT